MRLFLAIAQTLEGVYLAEDICLEQAKPRVSRRGGACRDPRIFKWLTLVLVSLRTNGDMSLRKFPFQKAAEIHD